MFVTDILAALCSGAALAFSIINIRFIARLPAMIGDTSMTASERNVKLAVFIIMIVFILIALVKFVSSMGKIIFRLRFGGNSIKADGGFLTNSFVFSDMPFYRKVSVWLNAAVVLFALVILLLIFPNISYEIGAGRTLETKNVYEHALWELNWFFPMVQFFLIAFVVGLLINVTRLIIARVKDEYRELSLLSRLRNANFAKCRVCGFDNHLSSVSCAGCDTPLRGGLAEPPETANAPAGFQSV